MDATATLPGLLGRNDPPPVLTHGEDRQSPFVVVCDHAGRAVPERLAMLGLSEDLLATHIGWDVNAWEITTVLADLLDAPAIGQAYSRLVIDCNRRLTAPDSCAEISDGTAVQGNRALAAADRRSRFREIMAPYHAHLAALIGSVEAFHTPLIVSVHSFTPRLHDGPPRPWEIGVIGGPDDRVKRLVLADLPSRATPLLIGDNEPYRVNMTTDYTLPVHAEAHGRPYVEFEFRNDCFRTAPEREGICRLVAETLRHARRSLAPDAGEAA